MRVAALQTTATDDRRVNLAAAGVLVDRAAEAGAQLVALPEYFSVAGSPRVLREQAEPLDGPTSTWASALAERHGIWILAGTFPEAAAPDDGTGGRIHNTSCLFGPTGARATTYRKVHLFDNEVPGAAFRESETVLPGGSLETMALAGLAGEPVLGLSVCYDLRFPELYRILALRGATVVTVPSAFTAVTGPPHWELLLRARAVENAVFVVAPGQVGTLPPGMPACHGHTMVIDPWGTVLAERTDPSPGVVVADLDSDQQRRIRRELPVLVNRRPEAYRWPDVNGGWSSEH
jgi:deaminated glutathione amidase